MAGAGVVKMWRIRLLFRFALIGGLEAACRHVASSRTPEGTSSIKFVQPPSPPPAKNKGTATRMESPEEAVNAEPILPLATPVCPPAALAAHAGTAIVGVRITVGTDGRVSDVGTSLASLSTPTPFAAAFRDAVEVAVAQWRFKPGEVLHLETVHDPGGDYRRVASREKVGWTFDVEFTFTATGDVVAGRPKL